MKILVVEDDEMVRLTVKSQLENPGTEIPVGGVPHLVTAVGTMAEAERVLDQQQFDYAFIDLKIDHDRTAGVSLLKEIVRYHPTVIPIMMTSNNADQAVEECLRVGAADYIYKPFEARIVHDLMRKARIFHRMFRHRKALEHQAGKNAVTPITLTSRSPVFQEVLDRAKKLRGKNSSIFLSGESGVGKDAMARYIWTLEEDESRVFIPVHCGAIPDALVESELFGHKKGAFSGAIENKIGKFEAADDGDIFLDEVATMSLDIQKKFLRVLQDKKITPLGSGNLPAKLVNIRVISATNENLEELVAAKRFREDLLYRLKVVTLIVPPLRERMEDLEDLVALFLRQATSSHRRLSQDAWELCRNHSWPGNVRELENAITVAADLCDGDEITATDIRPALQKERANKNGAALPASQASNGLPFGLTEDKMKGNFNALTEEFEQALVKHAIDKTGSAQDAAKFLGIGRSSLNYKRKAWGWPNLD